MIAVDGSCGRGAGRIRPTARRLPRVPRGPFRTFEIGRGRPKPRLLANLRAAGLFLPFRHDMDGGPGGPGRFRILP